MITFTTNANSKISIVKNEDGLNNMFLLEELILLPQQMTTFVSNVFVSSTEPTDTLTATFENDSINALFDARVYTLRETKNLTINIYNMDTNPIILPKDSILGNLYEGSLKSLHTLVATSKLLYLDNNVAISSVDNKDYSVKTVFENNLNSKTILIEV